MNQSFSQTGQDAGEPEGQYQEAARSVFDSSTLTYSQLKGKYEQSTLDKLTESTSQGKAHPK